MASRTLAYMGNINPSLRLVCIWFDEASGNIETSDQAIVAWAIKDEPRCPYPIPAGGWPPHKVVQWVVHDREAKTWVDSECKTYRVWADLVGPLYTEHDITHPKPKPSGLDWPLDAERATPRQPPTNVIGLASGAEGVIGSAPRPPRPPSGPRGTGNTPTHPRDRRP